MFADLTPEADPVDNPATAPVSHLSLHALNQVVLSLYRDGRDLHLHNFQDWALEQVHSVIAFDSAWWGKAAMAPRKAHWVRLFHGDASVLHDCPAHGDQDLDGDFLTLWRHNARQPFSEADRQAKALLMPHLAQTFRAVRLRHFLASKGRPAKAWALADDQGFIRELSPAFAAVLQTHWPTWRGRLLPEPLARSVVDGRAFQSKALTVDVKQADNLRFLEVKSRSPLDRLTPREGEIVTRYARGETYSVIAAALALSPTTVRNHISHCFKKLEVKNKAELANLLSSKRRADSAGV